MILADTSIWVDHFRPGQSILAAHLEAAHIAMHAYVLGEIAMGALNQRARILSDLHDLTQAPIADHHEVLALVETHTLFGSGIGYIDAHLLASTLLAPGMRLWTRDKRLHAAAVRLGVAAAVSG